jgi:putative glutamine amidotransferase
MTVSINPDQFLPSADENPAGPLIPMVVSLGFPGMGRGAARIQEETTLIAFESVREAGGRPRLIEYTTGSTLQPAEEVFGQADGIIFLGGADVDPETYGFTGDLPENLYGIDRTADDYCIELLQEAAQLDLPTLAICRGSQLLNVAFGGTLIPDIENWQLHKGDGNPLFINEEVLLEPDSRIAEVLGRTTVSVRNGHHQAVDQVGHALRATVRAHDGIVEGTEHRTASWMVGVQWHPEEPGADLDDRRKIFQALVNQATAR